MIFKNHNFYYFFIFGPFYSIYLKNLTWYAIQICTQTKLRKKPFLILKQQNFADLCVIIAVLCFTVIPQYHKLKNLRKRNNRYLSVRYLLFIASIYIIVREETKYAKIYRSRTFSIIIVTFFSQSRHFFFYFFLRTFVHILAIRYGSSNALLLYLSLRKFLQMPVYFFMLNSTKTIYFYQRT